MTTTALTAPKKDLSLAYVLWIAGFFGFGGIHRMYMGRWASGILWFFTGGLCMVGQVVDLFMMQRMVHDENEGKSGW